MSSYKNFFVKHNLITIEAFFQYVQENFHYGWMDQRGTYHHDTNSANGYALQSPNELLASQIGNCWDLAELYRCWFDTMTNLPTETYYIFYDDQAGCPSHAILTYHHNDHDKICWFEPLFGDQNYDYSGIHVYNNLEELLRDLQNQFVQICLIRNYLPENYNPQQLKLYHYDKPPYHITGTEMRNHIDNSLPIQMS